MITVELEIMNHYAISNLWHTKVLEQWFQENQVDLSHVKSVDSSAVAFLVKWAKECSKRNMKLECVNTPFQLIQLMNIYNVSKYIEIK